MVLKGIGCNGYGKPSTTQGFPFLQYLCLWQPALFMIPFCQETNGNRNPSVWSHKHKDLISHLLRNHRIYLIKELGNLFCIITEEVTTRGAGRSHLPWAVSVLRHVCAGQRATLQPRGSSVGSDERSVTCEPGTKCLSSSAHRSTRAPAVGGGAGKLESNQGKRRPQTPHSKLILP